MKTVWLLSLTRRPAWEALAFSTQAKAKAHARHWHGAVTWQAALDQPGASVARCEEGHAGDHGSLRLIEVRVDSAPTERPT